VLVSGELVAVVTIAGIVGYLTLAIAVRARSRRSRGPSLLRIGGAAALLPYLVPIPYAVIAFRPGPELAVPDTLRWAGLAIVLVGIACSMWAALTLGRHFDMEVELHAGHEVVRAGPYALVRHPVYGGLGLHLLGACLATGNLLLLAGTLLGAVPALYARASVEERLLREHLGPGYAEYAREVGMLVPFIGTTPR